MDLFFHSLQLYVPLYVPSFFKDDRRRCFGGLVFTFTFPTLFTLFKTQRTALMVQGSSSGISRSRIYDLGPQELFNSVVVGDVPPALQAVTFLWPPPSLSAQVFHKNLKEIPLLLPDLHPKTRLIRDDAVVEDISFA